MRTRESGSETLSVRLSGNECIRHDELGLVGFFMRLLFSPNEPAETVDLPPGNKQFVEPIMN
jgi:hypothetical protein